MLSELKEFLQYLKFKKNYPSLSKKEILSLIVEKALNEKAMPEYFIDYNNSNLFRLVYVTCLDRGFTLTKMSSVYRRPSGMNQEEVLKTISSIKDFFDKRNVPTHRLINLMESTMKNQYKFTTVEQLKSGEIVVDLYICSGDLRFFLQSKFYKRYFSWYIKDSNLETKDAYVGSSLVLRNR